MILLLEPLVLCFVSTQRVFHSPILGIYFVFQLLFWRDYVCSEQLCLSNEWPLFFYSCKLISGLLASIVLSVIMLRFQYSLKLFIIIIIIIIIIVSFMHGSHTHIPATNHVTRRYIVAAILSLLFMVPLFLVPALALLFFYISTFQSMCAVPNVAVFCSSLKSLFPGIIIIIIIVVVVVI